MTTLFLIWQDPTSRVWFPIGCLTANASKFNFRYVNGVQEALEKTDFQPLISFPDIEKTYESNYLFPLFSNRIMRPSRPDYEQYLRSLRLEPGENDPIAILSRSGGRKATDHFEVVHCPEPNDIGRYETYFFLRGLRYRQKDELERAEQLKPQENLLIVPEPENEYDPLAVKIKAEDNIFIGYCPRYLAPDIHQLLQLSAEDLRICVERVNVRPTPIQQRVLCRVTATWPQNFHPFSGEEFQPIQAKMKAHL